MFPNSAKRNGQSGKNPGQEVARELTLLNLSVHGASASIHPQRPNTFRECKAYTFLREKKRQKEFSFPVDRIVYLAERLELTTSSEEKCKSLSVAVPPENTAISLPRSDASAASPFSLDLSSITGDESDEGCPHLSTETPTCSSSLRSLPGRSCTDRCPCQPEHQPRPQTSHACCDLINLYVNSDDKHRELIKYFRPCCAQSDSLRTHSSTTNTPHCPKTDVCDCSRPFTPIPHQCPCNLTPERPPPSTSSPQNLAYASSLASAARSARLLARDLELVLSSLETEGQ